MDHFEKEADFEKALIAALQSYGSEKEVICNPTEKDLIKNWADILFENNRNIDRLNDCPLIEEGMDELLEQVKNARTPHAINGFINGKTVAITRKNPDDKLHYGKEVSLKIYDRQEIAAGQSRYQIVEHTKGYHERYVHLVPKAISIIDELKAVTRDPTGDRWMFVRQKKRITSRQITYILEKYSKDTGKPVKRSHKIRKTYGSTLHKKGVPLVIIKDELGHSDIRTTEQHYIYNQASDKETYNILKNAL